MYSFHLPFDPLHDNANNHTLFLDGQLSSLQDAVPFFQTAAAAGGRGVLGDKHGMTAHGCLLSVVGDVGRGQTFGDDVLRMALYGIQAALPDIILIGVCELEFAAKV